MLIVYSLICALFGNRLREKWKRGLLFLAMVFYLVPFAAYKRQICGWINDHCPGLFPEMKLEGALDKSYAVARIGDRRVAIGNQRYLQAFLLISTAVTAAIIFYQIYRCLELKRKIKKYKLQAVSDEQQRIFENAGHEFAIKRNVELCRSLDMPVPSTTGIFKAFIWLPEDADAYSEDELGDILKHELAHVMHHDLLVYVIGMAIVAIHWFNPFSYLLFHHLRMNGEQYSDEAAVGRMSDMDKMRYCGTLIRTSCGQTKKYGIGLGFSARSKKHIKRRIDLIMNKQKKHLAIAIAAGIIGSVMSTAVVLAYEAPATYEYDESVDMEDVVGEQYFWAGDDLEVEALPYDEFFTDSDGQIYPYVENSERISCQHQYVEGTSTIHKLDGKGGCTMKYYHAKRCTKCGNVVTGELYNSVTYKVCPH